MLNNENDISRGNWKKIVYGSQTGIPASKGVLNPVLYAIMATVFVIFFALSLILHMDFDNDTASAMASVVLLLSLGLHMFFSETVTLNSDLSTPYRPSVMRRFFEMEFMMLMVAMFAVGSAALSSVITIDSPVWSAICLGLTAVTVILFILLQLRIAKVMLDTAEGEEIILPNMVPSGWRSFKQKGEEPHRDEEIEVEEESDSSEMQLA